MAQGLEAALIAGSASITVGIIAAYASAWQGKKTRALQEKLSGQQHVFNQELESFKRQLEKRSKAEEMEQERRATVYLFAARLRDVAEDLGQRIDNIRRRGLLSYAHAGNPRSEIVMLSTAYRFARFFAMLEMLHERPAVLSLDAVSDSMEPIVGTLGDIGRTFASDRYGERLMIWREEQRAMGELVRNRDGDGVVGFATFTAIATGAEGRWFNNLITDLETGDAVTSERLALIQALLARLLRMLDPQRSYLLADGFEPPWMQESASSR